MNHQGGEWLFRWIWVLFAGEIWFTAMNAAALLAFDFSATTTAGRRLLRSTGERECGFFPVALLDHDKTRQRRRIDGTRVGGRRKNTATVAHRSDATAVLAPPLAPAEMIREPLNLLATAAEAAVGSFMRTCANRGRLSGFALGFFLKF